MPASVSSLSRRVLSRLIDAEAQELNPWLRDDLRIARLTVAYAARGEAVLCSPDVLASYMVLGLHPQKVWPAIQARSIALGPVCDVPKKPPQAVKLWAEKTIGARAANSRASEAILREPTISVPMAAPSIAALYPKPDASTSAKKREYTYDDLLFVVRKSYAPSSVVAATVNALTARGRWPNHDGTVSRILCVSLDGMMLGGGDGDRNVVRSTARWRARRAVRLGYWRRLRTANSWSNCPKCGAQRVVGKCGKFDENDNFIEGCGYQGRATTPDGKANFDEFCRPYMYELDIEKFLNAPPAKGIRHFDHRTYQEHKEAAKRGEHPNLVPIRKPTQPAEPRDPAPAAPLPAREQPAAERKTEHRAVTTQASARLTTAAKRVMEICGLPEIGGGIPYVESAVLAEAKFRGVEVEDAAKYIADCALRDQRNQIALTRFYFRDMKWRTSNGGAKSSASSERADRIKRNILDGFAANARSPDEPDGPERKE